MKEKVYVKLTEKERNKEIKKDTLIWIGAISWLYFNWIMFTGIEKSLELLISNYPTGIKIFIALGSTIFIVIINLLLLFIARGLASIFCDRYKEKE